MTLSQLIGLGGVTCILYAYAMLQLRFWHQDMLRHSLVNLIGAVAILISLLESWNLPSFIIEVVWITVSLYGIGRWWRTRRLELRQGPKPQQESQQALHQALHQKGESPSEPK